MLKKITKNTFVNTYVKKTFRTGTYFWENSLAEFFRKYSLSVLWILRIVLNSCIKINLCFMGNKHNQLCLSWKLLIYLSNVICHEKNYHACCYLSLKKSLLWNTRYTRWTRVVWQNQSIYNCFWNSGSLKVTYLV